MLGFFIFMFIFALWAFLIYFQICAIIDNFTIKKQKKE